MDKVQLRNNQCMSVPDDVDDLGPLPRADRYSVRQRKSIKALQAVLPADKFLFRDERVDDAGVDGSLELRIRSSYTNFRSQVQLKTKDERLNADGSVSVQIDPGNLNYLLSGPSPLYILYLEDRDELRFIWARDERTRIESANPEWKQQKKISIRFERVLTVEAVEEIFDRILRESRMQRRIIDALANASVTEHLVVCIDPKTLATTNPVEVEQRLLTSGLTIIASGYASEVINQLPFLNPNSARLPRIKLIQAYAEYTLGQYQSTLANLQQVMLRRDELTADDQQFATFLRLACDYQTGRIPLSEYSWRQADWGEDRTSGFALNHRLDALRYELLTEMDNDKRAELFDRLNATVSEVLRRPESSDAFKLQARLLALYAAGTQIVAASSQEVSSIPFRRVLGVRLDVPALEKMLSKAWMDWEARIVDALREATDLAHPLLAAFALITRVTMTTARLMNLRLLGECSGEFIEIPEGERLEAMAEAERAQQIFMKAGHLEGELRAKLQLADFFLLGGQRDASRTLAKDVLPKAEAMGYGVIAERAQEHLSDNTLLDRQRAEIERASTADDDYGWASASDEKVRAIAADALAERKLPIERLAVAESDLFANRDIARERLSWCRHINLIQDLRHTKHQSTLYAAPLKFDADCEKFGYRTEIGISDWQEVISVFKRRFCDGCSARDPKQPPPPAD